MPPPASAAQSDHRIDDKQRLRLRRLLLSVAVYLPCALMLLMVTWLGFLPRWFTPLWLAIFTVTNTVFYALIKSGLNLRLNDPSMTMAQMTVAIAAVAVILYHADAIRGGMLMLLLVIPLQLLSGSMTPRESMPQLVQDIMLAAPTTHFVELAQAILYRGAGIGVVWKPFLALALIGSALFALALTRFRRTISQMA